MSSSHTDETVAIEVTMPKMGVSVAEGTILEWRKQPGDQVEPDETLCEISTDKIDVEVPSPAAGRLLEILVEPGTTVAVGAVLARIEPAGAGPAEPTEHRAEHSGGREPFYSPVARRLAAAHGVPLERLSGTGEGGRVRKQDVLDYIDSNGDGEGGDSGPSDAPAEAAPLHIDSPYREEADGERTLHPPSTSIEMSPMRAAIARHMHASRQTAAHCTTVVEVDYSAVLAARARLRETAERHGIALTPLAFVALATVEQLAAFPIFNASIEEESITTYDGVNLGIAVDVEEGLVVPVIREAHLLGLEGVAAAIASLARRAREGELEPDDLEGGTFTITNPGGLGSILATPIIHRPQVAILDLEAIVKRPVVIEGEDGAGDTIGIRPIGNLCMSWDHRALDGATAARFLAALKTQLENWEAK